jgi:hypothetical protein
MRRNEEGRANLVGSLRTGEKARSAVRNYQKNRGFVTAARACAARLMVPGAALEIPRLSRGCLDPFCPAGDRKRSGLVEEVRRLYERVSNERA